MQIYVVTSGSYSDYHIEAVFTDKALAEQFRALYDHNDIDEYTADALPDSYSRRLKGEQVWLVMMDKNGTMQPGCPYKADYDRKEGDFILGTTPRTLYVYRWSDNPERVIKIANEIRTQKIALGEWE